MFLAIEATPDFDRKAAINVVKKHLEGTPQRHVARLLVGLRAITAHRQKTDEDLELQIRIYAKRLSCYPADVLEHVMLHEPWEWFPDLVKIERRCQHHLARRRLILAKLENGEVQARNTHRAAPESSRKTMSEEDRIRILNEVGFSCAATRRHGPAALGALAASMAAKKPSDDEPEDDTAERHAAELERARLPVGDD